MKTVVFQRSVERPAERRPHGERTGAAPDDGRQALVRYLQVAAQRARRRAAAADPGDVRDLRPRQRRRPGQALDEYGDELPYYQPRNEQSHGAHGGRLRQGDATDARRWPARRRSGPARPTWSPARRSRRSTACRCCCCPPTTTRRAARGRCCSSSSTRSRWRRQRQRLLPAGQPLLRPHHAAGAAADALPEAMRVLTDPAETGAVTIALPQDVQSHAYDYPDRVLRAARLGDRAARRPVAERDRRARRAAARRAERPLHHRRRRRALLARPGRRWPSSPRPFGIPVGETFGRQGRVPRRRAGWRLGGLGVEGNPARRAIAREADLVICVGTRLTDFATGSQSLFQHPDVRFASINVTGHDAHKLGALPIVADAREALRGAARRPVARPGSPPTPATWPRPASRAATAGAAAAASRGLAPDRRRGAEPGRS